MNWDCGSHNNTNPGEGEEGVFRSFEHGFLLFLEIDWGIFAEWENAQFHILAH